MRQWEGNLGILLFGVFWITGVLLDFSNGVVDLGVFLFLGLFGLVLIAFGFVCIILGDVQLLPQIDASDWCWYDLGQNCRVLLA